MAIEHWSDRIVIARLTDDPQFTDDMVCLETAAAKQNIILDFSAVTYIASSNIARLLRLRKAVVSHDHRLVICGVPDRVWSLLLVTGIDKLFTTSENVTTALAAESLMSKS